MKNGNDGDKVCVMAKIELYEVILPFRCNNPKDSDLDDKDDQITKTCHKFHSMLLYLTSSNLTTA